jgi:hypothetical protein
VQRLGADGGGVRACREAERPRRIGDRSEHHLPHPGRGWQGLRHGS